MEFCSSRSAIGWFRALPAMDGDAIANEAPPSLVSRINWNTPPGGINRGVLLLDIKDGGV
jgi:hypothetical protein